MSTDHIRVLLVDDQADAREWLAEWLRRAQHFEVDTARDGDECLTKVHQAQGKYDVLLLDLCLGGGEDGIEIMRRAKAAYPDIEVIIMTGFGCIGDGVRAMKAGAYRYVLKPLDREELVVYIRHAAERLRARDDIHLTQVLTKLYESFSELFTTNDLELSLRHITNDLYSLLDLTTCTVCLLDPTKTKIEVIAQCGLDGVTLGTDGKIVRELAEAPPDVLAAFKANEIIEISDLDERPDMRRMLLRPDIKSLIILPLCSKMREPLGIITMGSKAPLRRTKEHKNVLKALGRQVAIVVENAQLHEQARMWASRLEALDHVALEIAKNLEDVTSAKKLEAATSAVEISVLLSMIVEQATTLLQGSGGGIYLLDDAQQKITAESMYGLPDLPFDKMEVDKNSGVVGEVLRRGAPFSVTNYSQWSDRRKELDRFNLYAVVGAPVVFGERLLGVLAVHDSNHGKRFSPDDEKLLLLLGKHAGVAIENARGLAERATLGEITKVLVSELDLNQLLDNTLEVLHKQFKYSSCAVLLKDPSSNKLSIVRSRNYPESVRRHTRIEIGGKKGVTGWVAQTGQPLIVPDVSKDGRYIPGVPNGRSEIAVPLQAGGQVIGVLDVESTELNAFDEHDQRSLIKVAEAFSIAIANAQLFEKKQQEIANSAALADVTQAVIGARDLNEGLQIVAEEMRNICSASFCIMMLHNREGQQLEVRATHPLPRSKELDWDPKIYEICDVLSLHSWGSALRNGNPALLTRADDAGNAFLDTVAKRVALKEELESVLLVPLGIETGLIGICMLGQMRGSHHAPFSDERQRVAMIMATQVAVALASARHLELEHERTHIAQRLNEIMTQMSKTVMEPLALDEVLNLIARSGQELLGAEVCSVFMVRRAGFLSLEAVCGAKDNSFRRGLELEITDAEGGGLTGYIASQRKLFNKRGKELVNHPAVKNRGEQPHLPSKRCSSLTAVPLKRKLYDKGEEKEEVIGLIKAENKKNRAGVVDPERGFDYDDTVILAALATYAETAIRNAQLFDLANVSQKVVKVASSTLNLDEVLQHVLAELRTLIPFETASIQLLEEDELRVVACEGFGEKDREKVLQLRYPLEPKYPNSEVVKQRKPFIVSDISTSTQYQHFTTEAEIYCSGHIRSWFGVPLVSGDKIIGMLSIESDLPDRYTNSHVDLAVAFAGQVVSSIENARTYKNASGQSLLKVVPILNIAGDLNPEILLKTIVDYAVDKKEGLIGADIAIIYLYNPETDSVDQKPVYAGSPLKDPESMQPPFTKASVVHRLIESREGRFRDNVHGDDLLDRMFVRRENVKSAAGLPLLVGDQLLGVMFINYLTPHSFTDTEKELINVFAQKAALDIQRARQYEAVNVQLQATSERLQATRNAAVYLSFMSAWAHDAAQHTYILRGDTESLIDYIPSPTPEVQAILERIRNVAEKIAELIPDAPSDLSDKRLLSVHEVIQNSIFEHQSELNAKRIVVNNQFGGPHHVLANEWLLKSAFNHLVQNAIKAMPGGGKLSFTGQAIGASINVRVKDTGGGIPPGKHQYLFWQRISSPDKGGGSGVGLILTRLYLNACDGDITLEHSDKSGTTFNIHLPAVPERP